MKKTLIALGATSLLLTLGLTQANAESDRPQPPSFEQMDINGDGELSKDEVKGPLAQDFDKFDTDGSGSLTEDELPEPPKRP